LVGTLDQLSSSYNNYSDQLANILTQVSNLAKNASDKAAIATSIADEYSQSNDIFNRLHDQLGGDVKRIDDNIRELTKETGLIDCLTDAFLRAMSAAGVDPTIKLATFQSDMLFTCNPLSGTVWIDATLPGMHGAKISIADLQSFANGTLPLPTFDPIEVALTEVPISTVRKSDWSNWHPVLPHNDNDYDYQSSEMFTDFFGADQLGADSVSAVVSGGASLQSSLARIRTQLTLEWSDLLTWAQNIGDDTLSGLSGGLFDAIVQGPGKFTNLNNPKLTIRLDQVPYNYDVVFDPSKLLPALQDMAKFEPNSWRQTLGSYNVPHIGFVITARPPIQVTASKLEQRLTAENIGKRDPIQEIKDSPDFGKLSPQLIQLVESVDPKDLGRPYQANIGAFATPFPKFAAEDLDILKQSIDAAIKRGGGTDLSGYVVDLQGTPFADRVKTAVERAISKDVAELNISAISIDLLSSRIATSGRLRFNISAGSLAALTKSAKGLATERKLPMSQQLKEWKALYFRAADLEMAIATKEAPERAPASSQFGNKEYDSIYQDVDKLKVGLTSSLENSILLKGRFDAMRKAIQEELIFHKSLLIKVTT
jgi:hypothetical protein